VIIGIGSDLTDIRRIQASLDRFGDRFTQRVFTEIERARSERRRDRAASYAKRFAAKEACAKALGTGFRQGVYLADIGVVNARSGQPTVALTGGAATRLAALIPPGMTGYIHVSLTDDHPYAQAFVVIEALPQGGGQTGGALAAGLSDI
jgi:holo-[acyl-carrier protein] synthase